MKDGDAAAIADLIAVTAGWVLLAVGVLMVWGSRGLAIYLIVSGGALLLKGCM